METKRAETGKGPFRRVGLQMDTGSSITDVVPHCTLLAEVGRRTPFAVRTPCYTVQAYYSEGELSNLAQPAVVDRPAAGRPGGLWSGKSRRPAGGGQERAGRVRRIGKVGKVGSRAFFAPTLPFAFGGNVNWRP